MQHYEIKRKQDLASPPVAWITIFLLLLCFFGFAMSIGQHGSWITWIHKHSYSIAQSNTYISEHNFISLLGMMFWATFSQINIWQLLFSAYFLWVFGSTIEERLGGTRYLIVVILCWLGGWLFLDYDSGVGSTTYFIGPSILIAGLIGGYLIFFPEKKLNAAMPIPKYTYRIFKEEEQVDPRELYGVNPWVVIIGFIIFQTCMHFYLRSEFTAGHLPDIDLLRPLPAMGAFLVGFALSLTLLVSVTKTVEGSPLRSLAWVKYRQLRQMDMTHEQSLIGVARLLSVPEEQIREWIGSGSGGPP